MPTGKASRLQPPPPSLKEHHIFNPLSPNLSSLARSLPRPTLPLSRLSPHHAPPTPSPSTFFLHPPAPSPTTLPQAALRYMVYGKSRQFDVDRMIDMLQALEKFVAIKEEGDGSAFKVDGVRGSTDLGSAG